MTLEILSINLDSLYLTVHGEWQDSMKEIVKAAKQQAQDDDQDKVFLFRDNRVAGGSFFAARSGRSRDYAYMLYNARFRLQLSTRGGNRPVCLIQVRSDLLYEYELPQINTMVIRLLDNLFEEYRFAVGRVDMACDFQAAEGSSWSLPSIDDVHSRAKWDAVWREHRKITGMTFGKHQGALQVQIYRKSETLARDGKQWMFEVWQSENPRFDPELVVYRVEIRFYREGLRMMQDPDGMPLNSLWHLEESLADLSSYAISGEKPWIRACDSEHKISPTHKGRRRTADWWKQIADAFARFEGSQSRKRVNDELRFHYSVAVERAAAHLRTAQAIARVAGWGVSIAPGEFARDALKAFYADSPLDWAEGVNDKLRQLQGLITGHVAEVA